MVQESSSVSRSILPRSSPFTLPEAGSYVAGIAFMADEANIRAEIEKLAQAEGLKLLGWRELPTNPSSLGKSALSVMPKFEQLFLAGVNGESGLNLDRMAFCLRKRAEHSLNVYFPSLSSQTIVYKGMLTTDQLEVFFPDLSDERVVSPFALVHSLFHQYFSIVAFSPSLSVYCAQW